MTVESEARLFSAPNVASDGSHNMNIPFPSLSKIIQIAMKTLHITGVAVFTLLCPYVSIGVCTVIFISSMAIIARNKSEIVQQQEHQNGFDEATTRRALVAMKESIALHEFSQLTNAVCITALAVSWAVNPVWLVLSTFFLTANWVISSTESKVIKQMKRTFDDQTQSTKELHQLERLYPESFNQSPSQARERIQLLMQERELRNQKKKYNLTVKECVAKAWEHLLNKGYFTIEQGLEGDWNIFQPVCRLAIIKELGSKKLNLAPNSIAPSLRKRIAIINTIRESYGKLGVDEKAQVIQKAIDPDTQISEKLTSLVNLINSVADPMMQVQGLFQDPLIHGAEGYCLKKLHFITFLKLQKLKIDNYGHKLFFKADRNQPAEPADNHSQVNEEPQEHQLQGFLVINGERMPIRNIQIVR